MQTVSEAPLDKDWMMSGISELKGSMWAVVDMPDVRYVRLSAAACMDLMMAKRELDRFYTVDQLCQEITVSPAIKDWLNERMGVTQ